MSDYRDPKENDALKRWEKVAAKLTEDERDSIGFLVDNLEYCLKFGGGQIWLGIEAKTLLACRIYKVDWFEDPPKPKGRREAIEHTRKLARDA